MQWLSFGDVAPMAERVKAAGIKLMIQVQSVHQAIEAVTMGADAIVAQVWNRKHSNYCLWCWQC